jgi:hypothetical protein
MERSDVKDQIMTTKMALVKEGILDKGEVNKPISAVSAEASGLNDWRCWMAGELNKTKHA